MLNFFVIIFAVVFVGVPVLIFALTLFYMISEIIHIRKARANLKILGLTKENKLLESYVSLVREAYTNGTSLKPKRVSESGAFISPGPIEFYKARLKSNCFSQWTYYINKPFCHRQL